MLEKIKIGTSPLSNKINLHRMGKDPVVALETKDVTLDTITATIEHLLGKPGHQGVLEAKHAKFGAARFIISVKVVGIPDLGTLIQGTQRVQDLLPAFWLELLRINPELAMQSIEEHFHDEAEPLFSLITAAKDNLWPEEHAPVWEMHEVFEYINGVLVDLLDVEAQAHNFYFGANEGDGSDYGFWPAQTTEEQS